MANGGPERISLRVSRLLAPDGSGEEARSCGSLRSLRVKQHMDGRAAQGTSVVRKRFWTDSPQKGPLGNTNTVARKTARRRHRARISEAERKQRTMTTNQKHYRYLMLHLRRQKEAGVQRLRMTETNLFAVEEAKKLIAEKGHLENLSKWKKQDLELARWALKAAQPVIIDPWGGKIIPVCETQSKDEFQSNEEFQPEVEWDTVEEIPSEKVLQSDKEGQSEEEF